MGLDHVWVGVSIMSGAIRSEGVGSGHTVTNLHTFEIFKLDVLACILFTIHNNCHSSNTSSSSRIQEILFLLIIKLFTVHSKPNSIINHNIFSRQFSPPLLFSNSSKHPLYCTTFISTTNIPLFTLIYVISRHYVLLQSCYNVLHL